MTLRALLIGIECYLPNSLPDGADYPSLTGCVRDVQSVENYLRFVLGVPEACIAKLTATSGADGRPTEPREQWPTYESMRAALGELAQGMAGDQVYIHYSGHGGRTKTVCPRVKGERGLDECLVPTDIGSSTARYLRDVEVAHLLKAMIDRGLVVTIILDCCYAGGATRAARSPSGKGAVPRGTGIVDYANRLPSSVASAEELAASWHALAGRIRGLDEGFLPNANDYVLLAACRPSELAFEYTFDGNERSGALTYWFLDTLRSMSAHATYSEIKDRVVAKIRERFERQTPMLIGPGDRVIFGSERRLRAPAATVIRVGADEENATLNVGEAHGVRTGAAFAVFPPDAVDLSNREDRTALLSAVDVSAVESTAKVIEKVGHVQIGARAVLVGPGSTQVRRSVGLLFDDRVSSQSVREDETASIIRSLKAAIQSNGDGWLEFADQDADYWIVVGEGQLRICDGAEEPIVAGSYYMIGVDTALLLREAVRRIVHLAKYRAVQQLENHDLTSPLAHGLEAVLLGWMKEFTLGEQAEPKPFDNRARAGIHAGEWAFLRITNTSASILNLVVLDLRPGFEIKQIFPGHQGNSFWPLGKQESINLPLRGDLPPGVASGIDLLKVIATKGTTDFHVLELPPFGARGGKPKSGAGAAPGTLAYLLARLASDRQTRRAVDVEFAASHDWTVAQVELEISAEPAVCERRVAPTPIVDCPAT